MDKLKAMQVFTRVVELSSFSKAADALQMPRGAVSRHIQELEAWLGNTLVSRTTRRMQITTVGADFYERSSRILSEVTAIESALVGADQCLKGSLRLHMNAWVAKLVVIPALHDFYTAFPGVRLTIDVGNDAADPLEIGADCVIRIGALENSTLIAKGIAQLDLATVVSPLYINQHGLPSSVENLAEHVVIGHSHENSGRITVPHFSPGGVGKPESPPPLIVNDHDAMLHACLNGLGVAQLPAMIVETHLRNGALIEILASYRPAAVPLSAVMPPGPRVTPIARAFVTWLCLTFSEIGPSRGLNTTRPHSSQASTCNATVSEAILTSN